MQSMYFSNFGRNGHQSKPATITSTIPNWTRPSISQEHTGNNRVTSTQPTVPKTKDVYGKLWKRKNVSLPISVGKILLRKNLNEYCSQVRQPQHEHHPCIALPRPWKPLGFKTAAHRLFPNATSTAEHWQSGKPTRRSATTSVDFGLSFSRTTPPDLIQSHLSLLPPPHSSNTSQHKFYCSPGNATNKPPRLETNNKLPAPHSPSSSSVPAQLLTLANPSVSYSLIPSASDSHITKPTRTFSQPAFHTSSLSPGPPLHRYHRQPEDENNET